MTRSVGMTPLKTEMGYRTDTVDILAQHGDMDTPVTPALGGGKG